MAFRTFTDLTGKEVLDGKVIAFDGLTRAGQSYWIVRDRTGATSRRRVDRLNAKPRQGANLGGLPTSTPGYPSWYSMIRRCYCAHCPDYKYYGARGITVCQRWLTSFANFVADMGPRPSAKHSIDRINNDGNYEPANCRWATASEQARNKRRSA